MIKRLFGRSEPEREPAAEKGTRQEPAAPDQAPAMAQDEAVQRLMEQLAGIGRIEAAVASLLPMLQFTAKGLERSDRNREQQLLELRGHFTDEVDRLGASLRLEASKQAALDVFKAVLPALDDIDVVLRQDGGSPSTSGGRSVEAMRMVRDKIAGAFARLGIEAIAIEPGTTRFDAEVHQGEPYGGPADVVAGVAPDTIVEVRSTGYRTDELLIRPAKVVVVAAG